MRATSMRQLFIFFVTGFFAMSLFGLAGCVPPVSQGGLAATELPTQKVVDRLIPVKNEKQRRLRGHLLIAVIADHAAWRVANHGPTFDAPTVETFIAQLRRSSDRLTDETSLWINKDLHDLKWAVIHALGTQIEDGVRTAILGAIDIDGVLNRIERGTRLWAAVLDAAKIVARVSGTEDDPADLGYDVAMAAGDHLLDEAEQNIKVLAETLRR
jgi:hypothetical protein